MTGSNSKYVPRLQSLAGIDEMVEALVHQLEALGALNNTYIIFTSDNGFHLVSLNQVWNHHHQAWWRFRRVLSLPYRFQSKCTPGRAGIAGCMLWAFCHITLCRVIMHFVTSPCAGSSCTLSHHPVQGHHALCHITLCRVIIACTLSHHPVQGHHCMHFVTSPYAGSSCTLLWEIYAVWGGHPRTLIYQRAWSEGRGQNWLSGEIDNEWLHCKIT